MHAYLRNGIAMAVNLGLFLTACSSVAAADPALTVDQRKKPEKRRLILCNDSATASAPNRESPLGIDGLVRSTIDPIRGTMIDTLYWQLGTDLYLGTPSHRLSDWYLHNTKIGRKWGEGIDSFATASEWRAYRNMKDLEEKKTDSAAVVIEHGHKAGIDVFISLRINDIHDTPLPATSQNLSPMRREHPDWLLGTEKGYPKYAYNFAIPEVRQYMLGLVQEVIQEYDLDGVDLDFCREPLLFKRGETKQGVALINEMMRAVRAELDAKGRAQGRKLFFSVRVPPSVEASLGAGIDVATWITEGLVDIVIVADPSRRLTTKFRLPIERFRELAKGTNCKILAQNLDGLHLPSRPPSAAVLFGEPNYYTTEQFRATAALHWQAGADGIFLWNQHLLKFYRDDKLDYKSWREIGDPSVIARKDKHYLGFGFDGFGGTLPAKLDKVGDAVRAQVEIADDIKAALADGVLETVKLRILVEQLTELDQIKIELNDEPIRAPAVRLVNYNDCWLDLDVTQQMRKGENTVSLRVDQRNARLASPLTVSSVEVLVDYKGEK